MRLRKITIGLLLAGVLLAAAGCDSLTQTSPNEPTVASFWESEEDALQGLNATYNVLQQFNGTYHRWTFFVWDQRSDLSRSQSPWQDLANVSKFTFNSYDFVVNAETWNDQYSGVFRANQVIQQVPEIDMDPELRARIVAEAKFLRALMYFNLVNLYGGVPMPLDPSDPQDRPEQRSAEEVWTQIETDLQEAQEVLPVSYDVENEGRASRGAATALLAKAHLQQREWSEAAAAFEQVINSPAGYGLLDNYIENFDNENENSIESVFEVQFNDDSRVNSGLFGDNRPRQIGPPIVTFGDGQPTQWFFEQFFKEETAEGETDPRLDATIFWNKPGGMTIFGQSYTQLYGEDTNIPYWKKYTEYYKDSQPWDSEINKIVIRYAGVLLMYAEALNEMGRTSEAYAPINQVRERVGLPPLNEVRPGMSQSEMREQIEHEQILELGGENERILYLLRHNLFETELDELVEHDPEFQFYQDGRELLPIPQQEVDINLNVEQSAGWQ